MSDKYVERPGNASMSTREEMEWSQRYAEIHDSQTEKVGGGIVTSAFNITKKALWSLINGKNSFRKEG